MIKTTNKDLSCKVMDAGIEIDADMLHVTDQWKEQKLLHKDSIDYITDVVRVPAPTACEWFEVMPLKYSVLTQKIDKGFRASCEKDGWFEFRTADTPADALAMMALWLVERGLWNEQKKEEKR